MKLHIWTDRISYLAVAHADSVSEARELLLKESDLGESGDGSCSERDKARRAILSNTSAVYVGRVAEFSLSDNAQLREQEDHSEKLHQQIAAKDRRIAELEAALKNFYAGHQGCSDPERNDCQCRDCLAYRAYKVGNTPALDAALAAAKREALEDAAREVRSFLNYTQKYASFTSAIPAVQQVINDCANFFEWKAREVKP